MKKIYIKPQTKIHTLNINVMTTFNATSGIDLKASDDEEAVEDGTGDGNYSLGKGNNWGVVDFSD